MAPMTNNNNNNNNKQAPHEDKLFSQVGKLLHKYLKKHVAKISRVFKEFDTSGDGLVDKKEFTVGIRSIVGKDTMTKEEISKVWQFVDKDGGGTVDYMEFCKTIRELDAAKVKAAQKRKEKAAKVVDNAAINKKLREDEKQRLLAEKDKNLYEVKDPDKLLVVVTKKVQKYLKKNMSRAIDLFRKIDTSGDGYIDKGEFSKGMKLLGLKMSQEHFDIFWKVIDSDGGGYVDTKELFDTLKEGGQPGGKKKPRKISKIYRSPLRRMKAGETFAGSLGWLTQGKTASQKNRDRRRKYKTLKQIPHTPPAFIPTGSVRYKNLFTRTLSGDNSNILRNSASDGSLPQIFIPKTPKKYVIKRPKASKTQTVLRCIAMREGLIRQMWKMLPKKDLVDNMKRQRMAIKVAKKKKWMKKNYRKLHIVKIPKRNYRKKQIPSSYSEDTLLFDKDTRLNSTGNLLFELKTIAIQTVEAIQEWEKEQQNLLAAGETDKALASLRVAGAQPSPVKHNGNNNNNNNISSPTSSTMSNKNSIVFMWNEQNYLLKMCTDLNFLRNWRKFLVKASMAEIESRYVRKNAMDMALGDKGNILEEIPTAVIAKLLKNRDNFQAMFDKHDKSGDGLLQRREFESVLKELKIKLSKSQMAEFFFVLDRDGNGEIDTKELLRALEDSSQAEVLEEKRFEAIEDYLRNEWLRQHGNGSRGSDGTPEEDREIMKTELCRLMYHAKQEHLFSKQFGTLTKMRFPKINASAGSSNKRSRRKRM